VRDPLRMSGPARQRLGAYRAGRSGEAQKTHVEGHIAGMYAAGVKDRAQFEAAAAKQGSEGGTSQSSEAPQETSGASRGGKSRGGSRAFSGCGGR